MQRTRWLIVSPQTNAQRIAPIHDRLVVGRECVGVRPEQRLRLDDPEVSRDHFELRVDRQGITTILDQSTNGTRVNDIALMRSQARIMHDGDTISIGSARLVFRAPETGEAVDQALRSTIRAFAAGRLTLSSTDPLARLSEREREILALIAQGLSNGAIADRLVVSVRTVETHVRHVMTELGLPDSGDENRRVLAVLTYLRASLQTAA